MKKTKFDIFLGYFLYYFCIAFFATIIWWGLYNILKGAYGDHNGQYLWQLILFAFVVGTLILNINLKNFGLKSKKIRWAGFGAIISAILILLGYGFSTIQPDKPGVAINMLQIKIGGYTLILGEYLFSFFLTLFIFELARGVCFLKRIE